MLKFHIISSLQLITHRVDSLLTGLGEGRLLDPLVSAWIIIAERFCKENNLIWHQDFPPEHPISELERLLTATFIRHQSLGPLVLAVVDRELSGSNSNGKISEPVADVIKLVHQTKWTLIKTRQQLNRSYKEVCAPMIDKCRFLLYEVRPVISPAQCAFLRNKILHQEPRFKSLVRKIINESRESKKLMECAKPEDILNVTIQSQFTVVKDSSSENLCSSINENIVKAENLMNVKVLNATVPMVVGQLPATLAIDGNSDDHLKDLNLFDSNCITDRKPIISNEAGGIEVETKTPTNDPIRKPNQKSLFDMDDLFIDDVIAKLSENCIIKKSAAVKKGLIEPKKIMSLIVDFILQDTCDVETLRRAMYCQVQRYQIRKQGIEMFAQMLHITDSLDAVQYNLVSGYLGLFLEKIKQHYLENVLHNLNMITCFQKTDLILSQAKVIEWAIAELKKFINQEQIYTKVKNNNASAGKDSSNFGTYVFLKKLPRARFLLSVFGVLCKNMGPNEISLVINSGALSGVLSLLKQTGNDTLPTKNNNELTYVFEDSSKVSIEFSWNFYLSLANNLLITRNYRER